MTPRLGLPPAAIVRRAVTLLAIVALTWFIVRIPLRDGPGFVRANAIDFVANYCGTAVAGAGGDPYRVEPLRSCEQAISGTRPSAHDWGVVPAPLPSFTLALLRPLTAIRFGWARVVWVGLGVVALVVAAACAADAAGLPFVAVVLIFAPTIGLLNIHYGEPISLSIALIGLAAACAQRRYDAAAGVFAALALLEPHVGLGAFAGTFVALPRARLALVVAAALLGVAGWLELGWARNVEYFAAALPAQARAELGANYQLSLAHLLSQAGMAADWALRLGAASYAVMLGFGLLAGWRYARDGARAAAVYLPVAFTSLGGAYMHAPEVAAALPGVLVLCTRLTGSPRLIAAVALALLAVPWNVAGANVTDIPLGLSAAFAALALTRADGRAPFAVAACCTAVLAVYIFGLPPGRSESPPAARAAVAVAPTDLAADDWAQLVAATGRMVDDDARHLLLKAPLWLGLILAVGAAAAPPSRPARSTGAPGRFGAQA